MDEPADGTAEVIDFAGKELLIVDDDASFRKHLGRALQRRGLEIHRAADYDEAMIIIEKLPIELCVIDLRMPGRSGLELLRDALDERPALECVVLTGYSSIATAVDAVRLGALNYLQKPADADDILAAFERGRLPPMQQPQRDYEPPTLDRAEWEHIQRVLADCGGNISEAARRLGIHRRTLQRKLDRAAPTDVHDP